MANIWDRRLGASRAANRCGMTADFIKKAGFGRGQFASILTIRPHVRKITCQRH